MMQNLLRILVTRPKEEAKSLINFLEREGFAPVRFPTIDICPVENKEAIKVAFQEADKIIFISRNAIKSVANLALPLLKKFKGEIFSIGSSSAIELYVAGVKEVLYPTEQFNTEALLELPELEEILDQHIVIFSGLRGKDLLAHTLVERGASVTKIATYERQCPHYDKEKIKKSLQNLTCIISTSSESLQNLLKITIDNKSTELLKIPLIVINQEMVEISKKAGFSNKIFLASNPTVSTIVKILNKSFQNKNA